VKEYTRPRSTGKRITLLCGIFLKGFKEAIGIAVALINTKRRRFALRALQKSEFMYTKLWAAVFA